MAPALEETEPITALERFSGSTQLKGLNGTVTVNTDIKYYEEPTIYNDVYRQRINRVHQVCLEENINTDQISKPPLLFSKKYRLALKQVAKIGTTTSLTIFHILNDGNTEKVLNISRVKLHGSLKKAKLDEDILKNYTILFPSRDPYTRLYSAFIDKVYIFNSMSLVNKVLKHAGVNEDSSGLRKYEVTFQMFLNYALDQSFSKKVLGGHYGTLFNKNTWLCTLQHFIVIKQESFSADMEYALKGVKVEKKKMEVIHNTLSSHRATLSVISILKTVMQRRKGIVRNMGQHKEEADMIRASVFVLTRLWKSFQIQGYIATESNFPLEKFLSQSSVSDVSYVLSIFLKEIKQHPVSNEASKQQRQLAMQAAFDNINEDTVKQIQERYKLDFEAFGYNSSGPE